MLNENKYLIRETSFKVDIDGGWGGGGQEGRLTSISLNTRDSLGPCLGDVGRMWTRVPP